MWRRRLAGDFLARYAAQDRRRLTGEANDLPLRAALSGLQRSVASLAPLFSILIVAPCLLVIVLVNGDRPLMSKQTGPQESETSASNGTTQVFRPYARLIEIKLS